MSADIGQTTSNIQIKMDSAHKNSFNQKHKLVQSIIIQELKAFDLLSDDKAHPRYKQIIANTSKDDLLKKDTQTLLKRREKLNERDSLTPDDIKKIFQDKKHEAIDCFNWTELICKEIAFPILHEIKKQVQPMHHCTQM